MAWLPPYFPLVRRSKCRAGSEAWDHAPVLKESGITLNEWFVHRSCYRCVVVGFPLHVCFHKGLGYCLGGTITPWVP
jgi:hypothetical protein